MLTRFKTRSGSIYEVDYEAKTWSCISKSEKSGLRSMLGKFYNNPVVKVGQNVFFWSDPFTPIACARIIETSPVVEMETLYEAVQS